MCVAALRFSPAAFFVIVAAMMKFVILAGVLVLAVIGVFIFRSAQPLSTARVSNNDAFAPWVEVIAPSIKEQTKDGEVVRELKSGNTITPERIIAADASGVADIHFPDGSIARLDSSSELAIDEASFAAETETLRVRLILFAGRTWSRTMQLASPESLWEVETSNAVATIRGTAFGVEYRDGASSIFVDQNEVSFVPRDPQTKERLEDAGVIVRPQEFVEVKSEDVPKLREKTVALKPVEAPEEIRNAGWVKRSKERDNTLEERIETIRLRGLEGPSLRRALREEIRADREFFMNKERRETEEPSRENVETQEQGTRENTERLAPRKETEAQQPRPAAEEPLRSGAVEKPRDTTNISPPSSIAPLPTPRKAKIESLRIVFENVNDITAVKLFEEDVIGIRVVARLSDGTEHDATREVKWQVLGDIGQVDQSKGIFIPRLRADLRELGKSFGNITATFTDPGTGELFFSTTPIFEVHTKITERTPEVG